VLGWGSRPLEGRLGPIDKVRRAGRTLAPDREAEAGDRRDQAATVVRSRRIPAGDRTFRHVSRHVYKRRVGSFQFPVLPNWSGVTYVVSAATGVPIVAVTVNSAE
jgi:hypothetical protein